MRFKMVGNKQDVAAVVVKNNGTAAIGRGVPVFYQFNGTDDGLAVVIATTAAAAQQNCFAGITLQTLAANGGYGEAQIFGLCNYAKILKTARAASTDSYTSSSAIAIGDVLQINTVAGIDAVMRNAAGATALTMPCIVAAETIASAAASASTTSDTTVTNGTTMKVFLRAL
jgi:hypothetical protein